MIGLDFPKVELHLHLDGAIPPEVMWRLAKENGTPLPTDTPEEFRAWLVKTSDCDSVPEYLKRFELPLRILQTKENLTLVTESLIDELARQGYGYAEIRFAPQLHCRAALTQRDAVEAVLKGRQNALARHEQLGIGILLCCMSIGLETLNMDENLETVRLAGEYLGKGVCGMDLAGVEGIVPLTNFRPLFDLAKTLGVQFTCHADSPTDTKSIYEVMSFGGHRIGHGHRLYEARELWPEAIERKVTLELCPTSNVQCKTRPSYREYPAKKLLEAGIRISISTDNMVLAATTLEQEYTHCVEEMGFTRNDLIQTNIYATEAAFMPEDERQKLIARLKACMD